MTAGVEIIVELGPVAHGGSVVARHEGRVVFVRHGLPGERVSARITEGADDARYWRADAVEILRASPDRVTAPCRYAGPGRCGGCDWQHATPEAQRRLKAAVVEEQLRRLAGVERTVVVEPVPGDDAGLGWRTRVTYAVGDDDRAGLRRHRSHEIVPIDTCLIAHPGVRSVGVEERGWPGVTSVAATASGTGDQQLIVEPGQRDVELPELPTDVSVSILDERGRPQPHQGDGTVTEVAAGRRWRVSGGGFWQVHPGAADALVDAVARAVAARPGERVLDLYSGVGLFAGALAAQVGPSGAVVAVEGDRRAVADARHNLADLPQVTVESGPVDRVLSRAGDLAADIVVLDPPRAGAKLPVVAEISRLRPRVVAYVACDPAALARDVATFAAHGYELTDLRAFDLFPMTHHVECVATFHDH
ncbi:class I SAM-dependent RNA methyltransferase [Phytoactinopolyspora limicola]|uniref:class I SAM-dependent RNA methyltransferase n=1 Tax=Phytoactinopolyspora limicola TaxID=2715536 RepID=UPI00140E792E|nr:class I SAM-dependent RNA methyltransferase [Phytoactinopolyspora limicola]